VDASGILLVDLEDLSDAAVLTVRSVGSSVLELEAVLEDPLVRRFQVGHELLRSDDEDHVGGPQAYEASWLPEAEAMTSVPSRLTAWTLPRA
jgi:hypothetical protein